MEVFRGLKFEHNADIGQNSHLWMATRLLTKHTNNENQCQIVSINDHPMSMTAEY